MGESGGGVGRESWILLRHAFDDVGLRVALVHQSAGSPGDGDGVRSVLIGDTGVVEGAEKGRIGTRRVSLRRGGRPMTAAKLQALQAVASTHPRANRHHNHDHCLNSG